jgi:hypothetical protein
MFEALLAVEAGQDLDFVLESYAKLQPELFEILGADVLPLDVWAVIDGGQ